MPKGKKFGGKDWKPGQSGNAKGRPPLPFDLKEAQAWSQSHIKQAIYSIGSMSQAELKVLIESGETSAIIAAVAKVIAKCIEYGDFARFNFLLDRTIGKVTEKMEVTTPVPFIIRRRDGEEVVLGAKIEGRDD